MLLTIPSTPERATPQTYILNVTDLIALVASEYYTDQDNWRKVIVAYRSLSGNQLNLISFIPDGNNTLSKEAIFVEECFNFFVIQSITIVDKQNGTYILSPSEIPNVGNYNIIFPSDQSSFFDVIGIPNSGAMLNISDDEQYLAVYANNALVYDAVSYFSFVVDSTNDEVNKDLTPYINFGNVAAYWFNEGFTKVYIAGQLGGSYLGEALPPLPVGPNYSSNPPRLISIDIPSNVITFICDIEDVGAGVNFGSFVYNVTIDETVNVAILSGSGALMGVDTLTGTMLWRKNTNFGTSYLVTTTTYLYTPGSFLLGGFTNYDGLAFPNPTPIKINSLTGQIDLSLPSAPVGPAGNFTQWGITPDKTKIIQFYADVPFSSLKGNFYIYESGSWNTVTANTDFSGNGIAINDTHIFSFFSNGAMGGLKKIDFSGNLVPGFTYSGGVSGNLGTVVGNKLFVNSPGESFQQYNATTGVLDSDFTGISSYFYPQRAVGDMVMYKRTDSFFITPATVPFKSSGKQVTIINTSTREKVSDFTAFQTTNPTRGFAPKFYGNYVITIIYGGYQVNNIFTGLVDLTFPKITSISSNATDLAAWYVDGDYLYLASNLNTTNVNAFTITDSLGSHVINSSMARVNLATKLVDTTFQPAIDPAFFGGIKVMSFTDNYVYIVNSGQPSPTTATISYVRRIHKTTGVIEDITPATLGLTTPSIWPWTSLTFKQVAPNKVLVFPFSTVINPSAFQPRTDYLLDNRPYIFVREDTLAQVGLQPDPIDPNLRVPVYSCYNADANELAILFKAGNIVYSVYNLTTNIGTDIASFVDLNANIIPTGNKTYFFGIGEYLNEGNFTIVPYQNQYMMLAVQAIAQNFRPYFGIVKMFPFGLVQND